MTATTDVGYAAEMPCAKIGNGNFIFVDGTYYGLIPSDPIGLHTLTMNGFQIVEPTVIDAIVYINSGMSPLESYNMDKKIDDGLPNSGMVIAMYGTEAGEPGSEISPNWMLSSCVKPGPPVTYNTSTPAVSNTYQCSIRFNAGW